MDSMNTRIGELIKELGIRKAEVAERLNVSQAFVSQMCSGASKPSDRTLADICREFNVNEEWLRSGEGPMFRPRTRNEELFEFFNSAVERDPSDIRVRLLSVMSRLSDDQWALLADMARKLADEQQKADPE